MCERKELKSRGKAKNRVHRRDREEKRRDREEKEEKKKRKNPGTRAQQWHQLISRAETRAEGEGELFKFCAMAPHFVFATGAR